MCKMTMPLQRKYREDPKFHALVTNLEMNLNDGLFTSKDLMDAIIMATTLHNEHKQHLPVLIGIPFTENDIRGNKLYINVPKLEITDISDTIFELYDDENKLISYIKNHPVKYVRTENDDFYMYQIPFNKNLIKNIGTFILRLKLKVRQRKNIITKVYDKHIEEKNR